MQMRETSRAVDKKLQVNNYEKSEYTMEYLWEKGIYPYVITMGTGMTTDRLFGGLDIAEYNKSGKVEYLIENSFMNHEFVVFEEMMDAPDYILEQLKDILSSGEFRNGTQIYEIKTKFIIACTNKSREEFAKNPSLKALMERFPLEHNVIWDNYTEASYTTLLQKRFGEEIDAIIPFMLEEYSKNNIIISPRIALDCYEVFEVCGPDALIFIAEFAKKPALINSALTKFKEVVKFKQTGFEIQQLVETMTNSGSNRSMQEKQQFVANFKLLMVKDKEIAGMSVNDDLVQEHSDLRRASSAAISNLSDRYRTALKHISESEVDKVV